jgi:hypothetical protein
MPTLQATLFRLDTADLTSLLGEATVRLPELLDVRNPTPTSLAEQVLRQKGPEGLLLDRTTRASLVAALSPPMLSVLHGCWMPLPAQTHTPP